MRIAIILRDSKNACFFRDALIGSIASGAGDNALLCSGFFQENFKAITRPTYQASQEQGFIPSLLKTNTKLELIGIHNNIWRPSYAKFCQSISKRGVLLDAYLMRGFNWHAKIFILKKKGEPVFGIIGSSNITANAFGVSGNLNKKKNSRPVIPVKFNYECDVYLWNKTNIKIDNMIKKLSESDAFSEKLIFSEYSLEQNKGITIEQRLKNLDEKIHNLQLDEFTYN